VKESEKKTRQCPLCGQQFTGYPALSRIDGKTQICPDCGTRQALQSIGVDADEQEQIIETIHRHTLE
jgi:uncharacterized Zn finger protein (UPF0148 family)